MSGLDRLKKSTKNQTIDFKGVFKVGTASAISMA
jgi:hypothetical protein